MMLGKSYQAMLLKFLLGLISLETKLKPQLMKRLSLQYLIDQGNKEGQWLLLKDEPGRMRIGIIGLCDIMHSTGLIVGLNIIGDSLKLLGNSLTDPIQNLI